MGEEGGGRIFMGTTEAVCFALDFCRLQLIRPTPPINVLGMHTLLARLNSEEIYITSRERRRRLDSDGVECLRQTMFQGSPMVRTMTSFLVCICIMKRGQTLAQPMIPRKYLRRIVRLDASKMQRIGIAAFNDTRRQ